jgi:hypothetical protein
MSIQAVVEPLRVGDRTRWLILRGGLIACLGLLLRGLRVLCRWDEWSLHYAGYYEPVARSLSDGSWSSALSTWTGLHPPLYGLVHACLSGLHGAPLLWLLWSAAWSLVAVLAVAQSRHPLAWLAALLLATDPVQLHYAAEVNNYPMLTGMLGLAWWARSHERWTTLAWIGVLAAWLHVLGGVVVGLMLLLSPKGRTRLPWMTLGVLPLLPQAIDLLTDGANRAQPPLDLLASGADALGRFGPSFIILLPVLLLGGRSHRAMAGVWAGAALFWATMVGLGLAAPHQFPYAMALGVPAAVLISQGASRPGLLRPIVLICLIRGLWMGAQDLGALERIWTEQDASSAVHTVLEAAQPGDAIVLVRGLSEQDDDKRHTSAVLWRFAPWVPMPPVPVDGPRHLAGEPRHWRGITLYTFDQPRPVIAQLDHTRVYTVAYGPAIQGAVPKHPSQSEWRRFGEVWVRGPGI